jgi:hypothetical protein
VKLAELQALFQSAVLAGDDAEAKLIGLIAPKEDEDRETLLGVYVHGYLLRLAEFLDNDYPILRAWLGDDEFQALLEAYAKAHPSTNPNARWFSARLPEFMREAEKWRGDLLAIGLAEFERALTDAFDAPDQPTQSLEALAAFSPEEWPRLSFSFHPSLRILRVAAGTLDAYAATLERAESGAGKKPRRKRAAPKKLETIAAWRADLDVSYRSLDDDELLALTEAQAGQPFGEISQLVAFQNEAQPAAERLAQFLVSWFSEGLVTSIAKI